MDSTSMTNQLQELQIIYFPNEVIFNLILSFFYGLLISYIYKKTHKGMSYSQSFMVTNIFLSLIVCMVIMTIGNNIARAFALVGALSIIRFRTVIKDTKDIIYIFWSLAAGMACGTGSYFIALASSVIITITAFILYKTNYGSIYKSEFILQFRTISNDTEVSKLFNKTISKFSKSFTLLSSESSEDAKTIKLSFDIVLKDEIKQTELISELSKIKGLNEIVIISAKSDVDY